MLWGTVTEPESTLQMQSTYHLMKLLSLILFSDRRVDRHYSVQLKSFRHADALNLLPSTGAALAGEPFASQQTKGAILHPLSGSSRPQGVTARMADFTFMYSRPHA